MLPIRVKVSDSDGTDLGEGNYVGEATVFFYSGTTPDGEMCVQSVPNAEEEPPAHMVPEGYELVISEGNPKIVLDNGDVVYGCQIYWEPLNEEDWPELMERLK